MKFAKKAAPKKRTPKKRSQSDAVGHSAVRSPSQLAETLAAKQVVTPTFVFKRCEAFRAGLSAEFVKHQGVSVRLVGDCKFSNPTKTAASEGSLAAIELVEL